MFLCSNKAVAVGAISYPIDRFVKGRISKFAYGVPHCVLFKPSNPAHKKRRDKVYVDELGDKHVLDAFNTMLPKVRRRKVLTQFACLRRDRMDS